MTLSPLSRRQTLIGLAGVGLAAALARPSVGATKSKTPALVPDSDADQTAALQAAIDASVAAGTALALPAGTFRASGLKLPAGLHLTGIPGRTILLTIDDNPVATAEGAYGIVIENIGFAGRGSAGKTDAPGLLALADATDVSIRHCSFGKFPSTGIGATGSAARIESCNFSDLGQAAIHSDDGKGLLITGNAIDTCGNAGIRIWRSAAGPDGSIITANAISNIDWRDGGNGQTGNGINIYLADEVIVSDNHIADCAFTAVRVNGTKNTQIRGNTCLRSGEVAIFSEFGFSGSVVADNIIDGAATGISITNLDSGGHLATCTGNIVRNITPKSAVNPDTRPVGIYAEAETVVANNTVDTVPGIGIAAGYGPFVRNLVVSGNIITGSDTGIAVSVVQDVPAGPVRVTGNLITGAKAGGIIGAEWEKIVAPDLTHDTSAYPNLTITDNTVS